MLIALLLGMNRCDSCGRVSVWRIGGSGMLAMPNEIFQILYSRHFGCVYEVVHDIRLQAVEGAQVVTPKAQDQAGKIEDMTGMMIEPGEWNAKERGYFQVLVAAVGFDRKIVQSRGDEVKGLGADSVIC